MVRRRVVGRVIGELLPHLLHVDWTGVSGE